MYIEPYNLKADSNKLRYEFTSLGINRPSQPKLIEFQELELGHLFNHRFFRDCDSIFNLAFGDVSDNENIDDRARTNNGDMLIVLRTVALAVENFLLANPNAVILFRGSTLARTRLYRMQMSNFYDEISSKFMIYSVYDNVIEHFKPNMKAEAFFIKRRKGV